MDKQKACEAIHNLGGCDASDELSKGYDAGITVALNAIEEMPDNTANKLLFISLSRNSVYILKVKYCPMCGRKLKRGEE